MFGEIAGNSEIWVIKIVLRMMMSRRKRDAGMSTCSLLTTVYLVRLGIGVYSRTDSSALVNFPLPNVPEKGNCNASGNIGKDSKFDTSKPLKSKKKADI